MTDKDAKIVLGPNVAARLSKMLYEWEHYPRYSTAPNVPATPNFLPIPKIGKAAANIAPRSFGNVNIWQGKPNQETQITQLAPVSEFNLLDRTITSGKFCWMFGQYIFGATFPAADVWGTVTAAPGAYAVSVGDFANGDDPGASITAGLDGTAGLDPPGVGATVYCRWHDRKQLYIIVSWSC